MKNLSSVVSFLDDYLKINEVSDNSWNGLQFEGKSEVNKVMFAVDAGVLTFQKAIEERADLIVVHHGHYWKNSNPSLVNWSKKRINLLYKSNISLYAVHLPLDMHPIVGNNAQLLKIIGAEIIDKFDVFGTQNIGWIGKIKETPLETLVSKLNNLLNTNCHVLPFGRKKVWTIAVCSGGGGYPRFYEALNKKVDLYLTGDSVEVYHSAKDAKMNVIFAGHHATETVGVKALSKVMEKELNIKTIFIDLPTGL